MNVLSLQVLYYGTVETLQTAAQCATTDEERKLIVDGLAMTGCLRYAIGDNDADDALIKAVMAYADLAEDMIIEYADVAVIEEIGNVVYLVPTTGASK